MPVKDPHTKRAYTRSYQRAVFALRDRHRDEFAEILAVERAAALGEDTTLDLPPGPAPGRGARPGRWKSRASALNFQAEITLGLTVDEADDILAILTEARRSQVRVRSGRWQAVGAVMTRLEALIDGAVSPEEAPPEPAAPARRRSAGSASHRAGHQPRR